MFLSLVVPLCEPDENDLARQSAIFFKKIGLSDVDQAALKAALKTLAAHSAWQNLVASDRAAQEVTARISAIVQNTRSLQPTIYGGWDFEAVSIRPISRRRYA